MDEEVKVESKQPKPLAWAVLLVRPAWALTGG